METTDRLTNLQLELLKIFSFDISEDQINDIRSLLAHYFADKVTEDMDNLFKSNDWGNEKIEEWAQEHMRTEYKS